MLAARPKQTVNITQEIQELASVDVTFTQSPFENFTFLKCFRLRASVFSTEHSRSGAFVQFGGGKQCILEGESAGGGVGGGVAAAACLGTPVYSVFNFRCFDSFWFTN